LLRRADGGSWVAFDAGISASLHDIHDGVQGLWSVGDHGTILRWDGASWRTVDAGTTVALNAVTATAEFVFAVGELGTIVAISDAGIEVTAHAASALLSVWSLGGTEAWAGGGGGELLHWNGSSWSSELIGGSILEISGTTEGELWFVSPTVVRSRAGGSWTTILAPRDQVSRCIAFAGEDTWVVGDLSAFALRDGGWTEYSLGPTPRPEACFASSEGGLWLVGEGGYVRHLFH
jgi:hypothetical protein